MRLAQIALGEATSGWAYDLIAVAVATGLSVLAAAVMWRLYEEPILEFRKKVKNYPVAFWALLVVQLGLIPAGIAYWLVVR